MKIVVVNDTYHFHTHSHSHPHWFAILEVAVVSTLGLCSSVEFVTRTRARQTLCIACKMWLRRAEKNSVSRQWPSGKTARLANGLFPAPRAWYASSWRHTQKSPPNNVNGVAQTKGCLQRQNVLIGLPIVWFQCSALHPNIVDAAMTSPSQSLLPCVRTKDENRCDHTRDAPLIAHSRCC